MPADLPTQFDVARLSKVSRSTVAAILRSDPANCPFSEDTRKRVLDAVKELNYQPNSLARMLRSRRTHNIAIVVPNFDAIRGTIQVRNMKGAGQRARELGYTLNLCDYEEKDDPWVAFQRLIGEGRFDGVLFFGGPRMADDNREEVFAGLKIPFVVLERNTTHACVDFDNHHGASEAVRHLIAGGRRRIGFLLECGQDAYWGERLRGYKTALAEAGIAFDPELVMPTRDIGLAPAQLATRHLIESGIKFDALFCVTDEVAMGALQVLSEHGVSVPDDVAIVGYDDSIMAVAANPPLTSVWQDGVEMGKVAIDLLHQQIEAGKALKLKQILTPTLRIRKSSGPVRAD